MRASAPFVSTPTQYTCPMHPEIVRSAPGACPICGMALEPRVAAAEEETSPRLVDMTRRFWIGLVLTAPLLGLAMSDLIPGQPVQHAIPARVLAWLQLVLATPVVLWAGWPFVERGWASVVNRSPNMFTLIALGTGTAYAYSVVATLAPGLFPSRLDAERHGRAASTRRVARSRRAEERSAFVSHAMKSSAVPEALRVCGRPPGFLTSFRPVCLDTGQAQPSICKHARRIAPCPPSPNLSLKGEGLEWEGPGFPSLISSPPGADWTSGGQ